MTARPWRVFGYLTAPAAPTRTRSFESEASAMQAAGEILHEVGNGYVHVQEFGGWAGFSVHMGLRGQRLYRGEYTDSQRAAIEAAHKAAV